MALVPWKSFGDFDKFFEDEDWFMPIMHHPGMLQPAMDLYETDQAVVAEMNLPNIDPDKIDIKMDLVDWGFDEADSNLFLNDLKKVAGEYNDDKTKPSMKIKDINPFYAKEPLSPHLAFSRQKEKIQINIIKDTYERLALGHDIMLVEGAGGLMVPLKNHYLVADLIKELNCDVIIVSRLELGTINHTLLTIRQLREMGLNVKGVIFSE